MSDNNVFWDRFTIEAFAKPDDPDLDNLESDNQLEALSDTIIKRLEAFCESQSSDRLRLELKGYGQ